MKVFALIMGCLTLSIQAVAQCPGDQMSVTVEVSTDEWGYEGYWQLVPSGNACGEGTLFEGGNITQVGCTGGGEQDATSGGYDDNSTISEDLGCLNPGFYDIIYVDDWGDGGMEFNIILDDLFAMYHFEGEGVGDVYTFEVVAPPDYDAAVEHIHIYPYNQPGFIDIESEVHNVGVNNINTLDLQYSVNGAPFVAATISGLDISPFSHEEITHSIPWDASEYGTFEILVTSGLINGNADMNATNDSAWVTTVIGDAKPDLIGEYLLYLSEFEVIGGPGDDISSPTDLDFHPVLSEYQVWVTNRGTEESGGSTVTYWDAGTPEQTSIWKTDGNAWHFMSLPTGIAFSNNGNFATSPGVKDANHSGGTFTGPTLWSSDMDIYAEPSGGNGSHLDMLHQSPFTMGICAITDNSFFAFCDWHGHIHLYDFVEDHGPGNADHSDGIVRKYTDFEVEMIDENLPCHLALDENREWLYIVDAGNGRIIKMNTNTGNIVDDWEPVNEPLAESTSVVGVEYYEIVTEGLIEPVGVDVIGDHMVVSDHATGEIIIYNITTVPAMEQTRISTGRDGLMGIVIGPDGLIWFVDNEADELVRVNLSDLVSINQPFLKEELHIYPNPASNQAILTFNQRITLDLVQVMNATGEVVFQGNSISGGSYTLQLDDLPVGTYQVLIQTGHDIASKSLVIVR